MGAAFTQYTAEFEAGGELGPTHAQRFVYVLEGNVQVEIAGKAAELAAQGYAFLPQGLPHRVKATKSAPRRRHRKALPGRRFRRPAGTHRLH